MSRALVTTIVAVALASGTAHAAEEWEVILADALKQPYGQTRHDAVKGIDTNTVKGLKTLWNVLDIPDPLVVDWYVREAAFEALLRAEGDEAQAEIERAIEKESDFVKEAIVYAAVWTIRKEYVKATGGNDDHKIEEAKAKLRKTRGTDYFELILPTLKQVDPNGKLYARIRKAFGDKSDRTRLAAIHGFLAYPKEESVELLVKHLEDSEKAKRKRFKEWVLTRFALEQLSGERHGEDVKTWRKWWEASKQGFTLAELIKREKAKEEEGSSTTVREDDIEFPIVVKEHGRGYPLVVLPWRQYEPDYFRPYFHGIEEVCKVYYLSMPKVDQYKGLARDQTSNHVQYPTEVLAKGIGAAMKQSGLEEFAVLAHGPDSSTLGMCVAAAHPNLVTHLIMINPSSAGERYGDAIDNVIRYGKGKKNREIEKGGLELLIQQNGRPSYEAGDSAERAGNMRAIGNLHFADPTSPEVGQLDYMFSSPDTADVIADNKWSIQKIFATTKFKGPVLVVMGTLNPWTPEGDMMRVAGFFPGSITAKMAGSSEFPFLSETQAFTEHVTRLLANAKRKKKSAP